MNSARSRPPTGRSNLNQMSDRSDRSPGNTINTAKLNRLNDPLEYSRPFTPEVRVMDNHIRNPPIFPKSRFPTIPPPDEPRVAFQRPLSCPTSWPEKARTPDIFDKSAYTSAVDEATKRKTCQAFVERNRDRLWKYDINYMKMSPRHVYDELINDRNFTTKMISVHGRERVLNLSSSEQLDSCIKQTTAPKYDPIDPFVMTLNTSRQTRTEKMERVLTPARLQHGKDHYRGFKHAPEYGNFSIYSGFLKKNIGLKR